MKILEISILLAATLLASLNGEEFDCSEDYRCRCISSSTICSRLRLFYVPKINSKTQIFDLRGNVIENLNPGGFSYLKSLRTLYLNNNNLTTIHQDDFVGLENLHDLFLFANSISTIHPMAFRSLKKLQNIYLQQNQLRDIAPGTFDDTRLLRKIILSYNLLRGLNKDVFKSQERLEVLRMDGNELDCNCDLLWLWAIKNSQDSQYRFDLTASCFSPPIHKGKQIGELNLKELGCEAPRITYRPSNVEVESLTDVRLDCQASGNPKPTMKWLINGTQISAGPKYSLYQNGEILVVVRTDKQDSGEYKCVAVNSLGQAESNATLKIMSREDFYGDIQFDKKEISSSQRTKTLTTTTSTTTTTTQTTTTSSYLDVEESVEDDTYYDNGPKFKRMPSDLNVLEGSSAVFMCRASNPAHKITWLKDGQVVRRSSRISPLNTGDLEIRNVLVEDEGFYICVLSDLYDNNRYAQAQLLVSVPVSFLKQPSDQQVTEGNSIELQCIANAKPKPKITWLKNGVDIKNLTASSDQKVPHYQFYQNDQIMIINGVNKSNDEGVYACVAENSVNRVPLPFRIYVNPSTKPNFKIIQQNISVFEDHPIRLECFANGEPKPQIKWFRNGQRIVTDSRVYFDSFGYLTITQVRLIDAGEYMCRAENIAGFAIHKFHLSVKDIYGTVISNTVIKDAIELAKADINRQYQSTLSQLNDKRRPKTHLELLSLLRFPKDKTLDLVLSEEVYERALDIIFRYASNITFNLTNQEEFTTQEILTYKQLQRISDLSGCHRFKRKVRCSERCLNYRSFDGTCNNLDAPRRGAANTALRRLLPAEYQNGFSTPRGWNKSQLYNGFMLPNAREVTRKIITTSKITQDEKFSLALMQWGQFIDHDLDHTVMAMSLNRFSNGIACRDSCTNDQPCFPIEIMANDTFRSQVPNMCMEFVRSSAVCGSGETSLLMNKIHQREQINQLTAYIDASMVYGSSDQDAFDIRETTANTGKLKVHVTSKYPKGLPPFNLDTNMDCQKDNTTTVGCFLAGDYRANEQLALLAFHNLWIRQHNNLVDKLKRINPHWGGEQLYQEARKIVGAQMQIITFEHWLPYILGPTGMKKLGKYAKYQPDVDSTISNEFATAGFRFGHGLIQPFTFRLNESFQPIPEGDLLLRDSFFAPQRYYYEGGMDPLLRGIFGRPAKLKLPREIMNSELTEHLFHITRVISQDLSALNIQRGRDHGLPGYVAYRRFCNMSDVNDFDDLKNEIPDAEVREVLRELYGDVRNIDIWPGGILESPIEGSKLGPLFMCIIVDQMKSVRDGDRFWYENPGVFTPAQLSELKKTTLARIICENSDGINHIQEDVFLNAKYPTGMKKCSDIESVSLEPWRNCCKDNISGLCREPAYFYVPVDSQRRKR